MDEYENVYKRELTLLEVQNRSLFDFVARRVSADIVAEKTSLSRANKREVQWATECATVRMISFRAY